MNGDPIGGFLFDHVPFFKGEENLANLLVKIKGVNASFEAGMMGLCLAVVA